MYSRNKGITDRLDPGDMMEPRVILTPPPGYDGSRFKTRSDGRDDAFPMYGDDLPSPQASSAKRQRHRYYSNSRKCGDGTSDNPSDGGECENQNSGGDLSHCRTERRQGFFCPPKRDSRRDCCEDSERDCSFDRDRDCCDKSERDCCFDRDRDCCDKSGRDCRFDRDRDCCDKSERDCGHECDFDRDRDCCDPHKGKHPPHREECSSPLSALIKSIGKEELMIIALMLILAGEKGQTDMDTVLILALLLCAG